MPHTCPIFAYKCPRLQVETVSCLLPVPPPYTVRVYTPAYTPSMLKREKLDGQEEERSGMAFVTLEYYGLPASRARMANDSSSLSGIQNGFRDVGPSQIWAGAISRRTLPTNAPSTHTYIYARGGQELQRSNFSIRVVRSLKYSYYAKQNEPPKYKKKRLYSNRLPYN